MSNSYVQNYILSQAQAKVMSQTQGLYPAPLKILDVIQQTLENGSKVGFNAEAEGFADLCITNESKALISLFHGRTECKKNKFGKPKREIKTIAVIGAGVIGAGIAHISIDKDFQVILYDPTSTALYHGQSQIVKSYQNYIKRNRITNTEYNQILSNLNCQTTFNNLDKCDIIIEAGFEDLKLKQNILNELEQYIPEHSIFAFNTYILSIHQIAAHSRRPHKVIGLHYFSPVDKVELLEIIRAKQTSDNTVCTAVNVGLKQGKIIIVVNDSPGFYTTRLLIFAFIEIFYLLQEGLSPNDIDKATKKFGFHIGLTTLLDEFGIDTITYIVYHLQNIFGERLANSSVIELLHIFVKNNLLGKKFGQGLYIYSNDGSKKINPKCKELLKNSLTQTKDISRIETIQWRICLRIINEAARCLEENVISSPTDGDIGAVFGLGFPPMKGGPFRFMDTYGICNIVDLMNNYQLEYGDRFVPTQFLIDMIPTADQFGSQDFCADVIDDTNVQSNQWCIIFLVGYDSPNLIQASSVQGTVLTIGTRQVNRPSRNYTYVYFNDAATGTNVHTVDCGWDPHVMYSGNTITIYIPSPPWIVGHTYYVTFDSGVASGTDFCKPESSPTTDSNFWRFDIWNPAVSSTTTTTTTPPTTGTVTTRPLSTTTVNTLLTTTGIVLASTTTVTTTIITTTTITSETSKELIVLASTTGTTTTTATIFITDAAVNVMYPKDFVRKK
ncbi:unnamed protein product [Rotaria sp. Silwood2]|nr:unnamed protein product [Rotaria sp. Silwood2]CAF4022323.1 unnamed protein product [Rotaria sp. Silwood2]